MSVDLHASSGSGEVPKLYRVAAFVALGWAAILLVRALYSCFFDVGVVQFLLGIVYYGSKGGSGQAETSSLSYAVFYGVGAFFILRGSHWARGLVCGVALVEGYNRLRSLTGALFDPAQRSWFTGQLKGELLLATFILGVLISTALVLMLSRRVGVHTPWAPPPNRWTEAAEAVRQQMQQQGVGMAPQQYPPQQAYGQQPYPAAQQPYPQAQPQPQPPAQQPPFQQPQQPQPQPLQQPNPYAQSAPQQPAYAQPVDQRPADPSGFAGAPTQISSAQPNVPQAPHSDA